MTTTVIHCRHNTAGIIFLCLGCLFVFVGCAQIYKALGLTEEQIEEQVSEDQKVIIRTVSQVRTTTAEIVTTAIAAAGTILSGLLARWLGTERKITAALITGIEKAEDLGVKESVKAKATASGIEAALHARVVKLT